MARPSRDYEHVLECTEGISGALADVANLTVILEILLRQVQRRVYGTRTIKTVVPAMERLQEITSQVHTCRSLTQEQLEILQRQRTNQQ